MDETSLATVFHKDPPLPPFTPSQVGVQEILGGRGWLLDNLLTKEECALFIAESERRGYDFKQSGNRYCYRTVTTDNPLAALLYDRLKTFVPPEHVDEKMRRWLVTGLNPSFRNCKYGPGNYFGPHIDFSNYVGKQKSWYTIMIYLNSALDGDFVGGSTIFLDTVVKGGKAEQVPSFTLTAKTGMAIVFLQEDDTLLHEGENVESGKKYMIRTDIMYNKEKQLVEP